MKRILFHSNQISLRGTEVALYDYAHFNEEILKNKSFIATKINGQHEQAAQIKFLERFGKIFYYSNTEELKNFTKHNNIDVFYAIKSGKNDNLILPEVKNVVHAVFCEYDPHGDVYAYVSEWLSQSMSHGRQPYVPHIVDMPNVEEDLRSALQISSEATVFGRYGGQETFDIPFAKRTIYKIANNFPKIYFLFMNTDNFLQSKLYFKQDTLNRILAPMLFPKSHLNNIIFLEGSASPLEKSKFIKTCDAMIHARKQGESFGIACGEFSILNKPVITCNSTTIRERSHIEILGDMGLYYNDQSTLKRRLLGEYKNTPHANWDAYSKKFSPETVMEKFASVFLGNQ